MSLLLDLRWISRMEVKIGQVVDGWINYVKSKRPKMLSEEMKAISDNRISICNDCDSLKYIERKIGTKMISRYACGECGCSFPMMAYSKRKKCPLGKW